MMGSAYKEEKTMNENKNNTQDYIVNQNGMEIIIETMNPEDESQKRIAEFVKALNKKNKKGDK